MSFLFTCDFFSLTLSTEQLFVNFFQCAFPTLVDCCLLKLHRFFIEKINVFNELLM